MDLQLFQQTFQSDTESWRRKILTLRGTRFVKNCLVRPLLSDVWENNVHDNWIDLKTVPRSISKGGSIFLQGSKINRYQMTSNMFAESCQMSNY